MRRLITATKNDGFILEEMGEASTKTQYDFHKLDEHPLVLNMEQFLKLSNDIRYNKIKRKIMVVGGNANG